MTDDLASTLRIITERMDEAAIPYMIVGSVAALAYGRSRATQDFDMVIESGASGLRALVASLPSDRFYVSEEAALDALRRESIFNVVDLQTGWKADLILRKRREFSRVEFSRRSELDLLGLRVFVASLEDVIVTKLEWAKLAGGSERQLEDVRQLVSLAAHRLDGAYVKHWVAELDLTAEWSAVAGV